jgi:hypothetical protein
MFSLEQSISEWRQQMQAAGIKSPVPLEELESHLREEIEQQIKSGISEQKAFEVTVLHLGQGRELQTEFARELGRREILHGNMSKRAKVMLCCWVVICVAELSRVGERLVHPPVTLLNTALLIISFMILAAAAYLAGTIWSLFLANSSKPLRNVVQIAATFGMVVLCLVVLFMFVFHKPFNALLVPFYFSLFTSMLLNRYSPREPKKKMN